jgi:hypothetical protein
MTKLEGCSVADPDLNVFGPPGSGSGSFYHQAYIGEKSRFLLLSAL